MLDAADASGTQRAAVHDQRVELYFAVAIEKAPASGVKGLVIFHDHDCFLDRIERRTAAAEHFPSRRQGVADAIQMRVDHVIRNGPGAAMDEQNGISRQTIPPSRAISLTLRKEWAILRQGIVHKGFARLA